MRQLSLWWIFIMVFGGMIVGIHGLRWCVTPANAAPVNQTATANSDAAAAKRHVNGEPRHWRSMLLRQQ